LISSKVKHNRTLETSLTHHGLVKLFVLDALDMNGRAWVSLFHKDPLEEASNVEIEEVVMETIDPFDAVEVMDPEGNTLDEDMAAKVDDMVFSDSDDQKTLKEIRRETLALQTIEALAPCSSHRLEQYNIWHHPKKKRTYSKMEEVDPLIVGTY
jgi:hypothetical protein